jgi:hypothetical protein
MESGLELEIDSLARKKLFEVDLRTIDTHINILL